MLSRNNRLRTFGPLSASVICLLACVSVAAQDSDRTNHQNVPSRRLDIPPGSYSNTCVEVEMRDGTLRATCRSLDGLWIKTELSDPSRCPGRIENLNGHLACGDSRAPSTAPERVASTSAQGWERTIAQFAHTSWAAKEDAPVGIEALAQSKDGYLWLGTADGLYRFDGVNFERYQPHSGGPLPREYVPSLLPLDDGTLWVGFATGRICLLRDGTATNYTKADGVPEGPIFTLAQDRAGTIWAASAGGLLRLERNQWKIVGEDWNFPGKSAQTAFVDRQGTLWVAADDTIVFLLVGSKMFQPTGIHVGQVYQIAQAPNRKLWMAETTRSVRPIPLGDKLLPSDGTELRVGSTGILFDQDGALWTTTLGDGIRRGSHPEQLSGKLAQFSSTIDSFTAKDGLTNDNAHPILQDREGNIWVGTQMGLDCFRKTKLVPVILQTQPLSSIMITGDQGDVWVLGTNLWAWIHEGRPEPVSANLGTDANSIGAAYRDSAGRIWWFGHNVHILENGRFTQLSLPDQLTKPNESFEVTEDHFGALWVASTGAGIFYLKDKIWKRLETPPDLDTLRPSAAYTDWLGRLWFGYEDGTIVTVNKGNIETISSGADSPVGIVRAIQGRDRHIWVGGGSGLAFFDGSRFRKVVPVDASTFDPVWGIEETSDGGLWLGAAQGVIHVAESEIQHFLSDSSYRVQYELFNSSDGLPGTLRVGRSRGEAQGTDGRLWFAASNGLAWLDPAHISRNTLPPPVAIQSLTADDKLYPYWASPTLPALTGHLEIKFTALSLSIPERDHFRYKLDGYDKDWRDAVAQRQASYTNLSPRKYRFRVIASNNDGVWNEAGATVDFSILPAWYQTIWFRSLCVAVFALFLWGLYQLRLRQLERQFNMTLEARVNERMRIARELHDSLLQGVQGLMFRLQAVRDLLPGHPSDAMQALDIALDRGDKAIAEGRDTVSDLREPIMGDGDIAQALTALSEELAAQSDNGAVPFVRVLVEGKPRELNPMLHNEIYRIGREALRNAFRHAKAQKIEAEIAYGDSEFLLHVRDDGSGIVPEVVSQGVRAGHWGLPGMRERAKSFGGKLEVWSERGSGTEIKLAVPASIAYGKPEVRRKLWSLRKKAGGTDGHQP